MLCCCMPRLASHCVEARIRYDHGSDEAHEVMQEVEARLLSGYQDAMAPWLSDEAYSLEHDEEGHSFHLEAR